MAKKKTVTPKAPDKVDVEGYLKRLGKKFGDDIFVSGDNLIARPKKIISVSPKLDVMLGGGIPEGCIVVCTGPPKVGKTSMCLHFAGMAQQPQHNGNNGPRHVFFHNIEMRLKERDLKGIAHLDSSRLTVIESVPGNIVTAEKHIEIALETLHEMPGSILVFDSFSALLTQGRMDSDIGKRFRDDTPLLLADFLRRAAPIIPMNNCIVLGVTHQIANQGFGHSPWSEASGRKIQYHCDVKLKATHQTPWLVGTGDDAAQIGQEVHWKCDWSAIGPPGNKCSSDFRYNYGIDKEVELINVGVDIDLIDRPTGSSWYTFPDGTKCQGQEKARQYFIDNPDKYQETYVKFREMMGFNENA